MIEPEPRRATRRRKGRRFVPAPPWSPLPRDVHALWIHGIAIAGAYGAVAWGIGLTFQGSRVLGGAIVGAAILALLALAWSMLRRLDRASRISRFFEYVDYKEAETRRRAKAKRKEEPQHDAVYWMERLMKRLARYRKLRSLRAPDAIIESERKLIEAAIAELGPAQAFAAMRDWPDEIPDSGDEGPDPDRLKSN